MSKNIARKGIALGAASALLLAGFTSAPAQAAGVDGTSQLVPTTGYAEGWAVPASSSATFSSTFTTTDTGSGTIKFKVEDPTGTIEPSVTNTARTLPALTTSDKLVFTDATNTLTLEDESASSVALSVGDVIVFSAVLESTSSTGGSPSGAKQLNKTGTPYTVTAVADNTFSFVTDAPEILTATADITLEVLTVGGQVTVIREARAADNSYVVDTGVAASTSTVALKLYSTSGASNTRSASVFGWVDNAALLNDTVDAIESTSSTETIQFVKIGDITAATALTAPVAGDTGLTATITTVPVLNGAQTNAANQNNDFVRAVFTRQDSTLNAVSAAASQSAVTGAWTATHSAAVSSSYGSFTNATTGLGTSGTWGFTAPTDRTASAIAGVSITAAKVASITTDAVHNLRSGDKVTVTSTDTGLANASETAATVTVTSTTSFTYALTETTAVTAASIADAVATAYTIETYSTSPKSLVSRVFAGTHSAQALINTTDDATAGTERYTLTGAASSLGTLAVASADVSLSTTGSASVQGSLTTADDATRDAYVKAGTLAVTVTGTVLDEDGDALGAGRSVAFTVTRSSSTTKVNDKTTSGTAVTDANGQVTFAVTDTLGTAGTTVTIDVTAENAASSDITLEWATQAFGLYDLNVSDSSALSTSTRLIQAGGSYSLNLLLADQWSQAPAAGTYRIAVSGAGVTNGFVPVTGGKATVTVTDSTVGTTFDSTLALQKLGTDGVYAASGSAVVLTNNTTTTAKITLGADATALYASVTVDLSDAVAAKALVERDTRVAFATQPAYGASAGLNEVLVAGKVTNSSTGANLGYAVVTVSGSSNILFSDGAVDKRGSITLVANSSGEFSVKLYSTTAQTDTVITVNAAGATAATTKVSFTGIGVGEGTSLVVTTPAAVKPASTFQVKAKLADAYGNGVNAGATAIKVTYTGPGIVFGTLPTTTDANGELQFAVLLGSNDTGTVTVTVSYDQNGDTDYVDAKDLVTTATTVINATGVISAGSADAKLNVGSFKSYVAIYAKGYMGKKLSARVAGKWIVVDELASDFVRVVRYTGAGYNIEVALFIDGVLSESFSVLTK